MIVNKASIQLKQVVLSFEDLSPLLLALYLRQFLTNHSSCMQRTQTEISHKYQNISRNDDTLHFVLLQETSFATRLEDGAAIGEGERGVTEMFQNVEFL